jgi:hypothetical protein
MYVMSLKALLMLALVLVLFFNAELFFVIMVTFPLVLVREVRRLSVVMLGAYLLFHNSLCCYPPG